MPGTSTNSIALLNNFLNTGQQKIDNLSFNMNRSKDPSYAKREALEINQNGFSHIKIKECVDNYLIEQVNRQQSIVSTKDTFGKYFSKIQKFFDNNFSKKGMEAAASLNSLSKDSLYNPIHHLKSFTDSVNSFGNNIDSLNYQAKLELNNAVEKTNELIKKISSYNNQQPKSIEIISQRRAAIHELSSLVGIEAVSEQNGTESIYLSETKQPLIIGNNNALITYDETQANLSLNGFNSSNISIHSGKLGALFDLNFNKLPAIKSQIDEFAFNVKSNLNAIHNLGSSSTPPNILLGNLIGLTDTTSVSGSGSLTISTLNPNGTIANSFNIDNLSLSSITNIQNILDLINTNTTNINAANGVVNASLNANGQLSLNGSGYGVVISGGQICLGDSFNQNTSNSFSGFFALNDLFISSTTTTSLTSNSLTIRPDILLNHNLIAKGALTINGVGSADGSNAFTMSQFYEKSTIAFSNNLNLSLNEFSANLIATQSNKCRENVDDLKEEHSLYNDISNQASMISSVNIEELLTEAAEMSYTQYVAMQFLKKIIEMQEIIFQI